ncbi:LysR family transcriptional regulator [Pseudomonas aeruginosa]|uniref:LysR family transcriptional regulator n=1 Tax=Pseudomonas aeruginosa TaxID=287 RepID=UPI0037104DA7
MTTFVSVVDARSFSEAARRLGTTKSQVSQRIQQLERRLGRVLLNRTRPLSLTDPGRTYYEHACRLLQELEQAEASVLDADDDLRGQLRLSAPLAFTPRYLAPLLARFAERHPQLRVDVQADDRFVNLQEPRFDMALRMGRLDDSCLVARPITANRHLLCCSAVAVLARIWKINDAVEMAPEDAQPVEYQRKLTRRGLGFTQARSSQTGGIASASQHAKYPQALAGRTSEYPTRRRLAQVARLLCAPNRHGTPGSSLRTYHPVLAEGR